MQDGERVKKRWKKELAGVILLIAALYLFVTAATVLLLPERSDYGSTWRAYLQEPKDSIDVLFFGSSMVYCDVVPAELWDETGAAAYVMGGSEQTMPITYRYVREAFRTQSPQAVFVEATGTFYDRYMNYTAINLDYMPRGVNWLGAVAAASEPEQRALRLFPLAAYHARWVELPISQLASPLRKTGPDLLAGYTFVSGVGEIGEVNTRSDLTLDKDLYAENLAWLEKIYDFCRKQGAACVFYLAPSYSRLPEAWVSLLQDDLQECGAQLLDLNGQMDEIGVDPQQDFYDYLHFNCFGAAKFSRYMGTLAQQLGVTPSDPGRESPLWQQRLAYFRQLCQATEQHT